MKTMVTIILLISILTLNAQTNSDSVNIKLLVQNQIKAAQEVLQKEKAKIDQYKIEQSAKLKEMNLLSDQNKGEVKAENDVYLKLYIILTAVFLAALIVANRRLRRNERTLKAQMLKKNIKLMREEVPYKNADDELSELRRKMIDAAEMSDLAKDITLGKNNFKPSKGEILLAEKVISRKKKDRDTKEKSAEKIDDKIVGKNSIESKLKLDEAEIIKKAKELGVSREEVILTEMLKRIKSSAA